MLMLHGDTFYITYSLAEPCCIYWTVLGAAASLEALADEASACTSTMDIGAALAGVLKPGSGAAGAAAARGTDAGVAGRTSLALSWFCDDS